MAFFSDENSNDILLAAVGLGASFILGRKRGYKEGYQVGYRDGYSYASDKTAAKMERYRLKVQKEYEEKMKEMESDK